MRVGAGFRYRAARRRGGFGECRLKLPALTLILYFVVRCRFTLPAFTMSVALVDGDF